MAGTMAQKCISNERKIILSLATCAKLGLQCNYHTEI